MTHSDTGGYTAVHFPGATYVRSEELLSRWCEVSAFTAIYRTHIGTLPSSLQVYSNNATLTQFAKFAKVYASCGALREELMVEAALMGCTGHTIGTGNVFPFPRCCEAVSKPAISTGNRHLCSLDKFPKIKTKVKAKTKSRIKTVKWGHNK